MGHAGIVFQIFSVNFGLQTRLVSVCTWFLKLWRSWVVCHFLWDQGPALSWSGRREHQWPCNRVLGQTLVVGRECFPKTLSRLWLFNIGGSSFGLNCFFFVGSGLPFAAASESGL